MTILCATCSLRDTCTHPGNPICEEWVPNPCITESKPIMFVYPSPPEFLLKKTEAPALATQVAGDHYKKLAIQPIEYIHANAIPFAEGNVIKYVTRWRDKGGIKDLEKAKHFIELLIELEGKGK